MGYETLLVEKSGYLTTVTLNRPDKLNAMSMQVILELKALFDELRGDEETRFIIFTGKGKHFSCGVEFSEKEMEKRNAMNPRLWQIFAHDFMHTMENLEQVTIAAVNGAAVGAGLCVAMNCDFRIASENAIFAVPEAKLGVFFTWGATPRLTALIGPSKTKEMIMTCDNVSAQEALRIGLVNRVVPPEQLMSSCHEMVDKIATRGPLAVRMCKKMVNAASLSRMADLYPYEPELVEKLYDSGQPEEGIRAFMEKRQPRFS